MEFALDGCTLLLDVVSPWAESVVSSSKALNIWMRWWCSDAGAVGLVAE